MSILDKTGLQYFYTKLKGKFAPLSHTHDDRYYTESEIDTKVSTLNTAISGKAASSHTHTKSQITDFPTSMPASDVYAWAKASTKPSYTYSEVGAAAASHSHSEYASLLAFTYFNQNCFKIATIIRVHVANQYCFIATKEEEKPLPSFRLALRL